MITSKVLQKSISILHTKDIESARLDALILLEHAINKDRSWILAHPDQNLTKPVLEKFDNLIKKRAQRIPIAYILGIKEFFGREFQVSKDVLIPRPETEVIVETVLSLARKNSSILDIGTGSGIIAISLKLERPSLTITASDVSPRALKLAKTNATKLRARINKFIQSDLLEDIKDKFDLIVANLPYVDSSWQTSIELKYEPSLALFADDDGLALIKKLIKSAKENLNHKGYLVLEADPRQFKAIKNFANENGLITQTARGFCIVLKLND